MVAFGDYFLRVNNSAQSHRKCSSKHLVSNRKITIFWRWVIKGDKIWLVQKIFFAHGPVQSDSTFATIKFLIPIPFMNMNWAVNTGTFQDLEILRQYVD